MLATGAGVLATGAGAKRLHNIAATAIGGEAVLLPNDCAEITLA